MVIKFILALNQEQSPILLWPSGQTKNVSHKYKKKYITHIDNTNHAQPVKMLVKIFCQI